MQVYRDLHAAVARDLQASSDISYSDFAVLVHLTENPEGRVRITDLATELNWDRSRVSHHLKRMEGRNLVSRASCPTDGRVAYIAITPTGRRAIEQAAPRHADLVRSIVFDHMSGEDLAAFQRLHEDIGRKLPSRAALAD